MCIIFFLQLSANNIIIITAMEVCVGGFGFDIAILQFFLLLVRTKIIFGLALDWREAIVLEMWIDMVGESRRLVLWADETSIVCSC